MNKSDLIQALADKEGLTIKMAEKVVNTVFDLMAQSLAQGDRVEVRGFGCFQVKDYGGYEGWNPKTGEVVEVKPKKLPAFKVGKGLKERVDIEE